DAGDPPAHRHAPREEACRFDLGQLGHPRQARGYFMISSSSTSKTSVAPGLIFGGMPRSPYARLEGHTSFAVPPTFISCSPSVHHGITPLSAKVAGSLRSTELSKTVPSVSLPV